jgi:acyl dehydratase
MVKLSEVEVGQEFEKVVTNITRDQIKNYAKASGDNNPIHINEDIAEKAGLKGVIAHGLLFMGFVGVMLTDLAGDGGKVVKWGGQFRGTVRPGDDVITKAKVTEINGNQVSVEITQMSKTPIKIEKDGEVVKTFEAEEKGWIEEKDIEEDLIKTEEVDDGTLSYRLRLSFPGNAVLELAD